MINMSRRIITEARQAGGASQVDTYFDRVIKYIPADIVAAWTAVLGMLGANTDTTTRNAVNVPNRGLVLWIAFVFGAVVTFVWTLRQTKEPGAVPARTQSSVATGAFAVWVYALGEPFVTTGWHNAVIGSLLLIGYTLLVGLILPPEK
jgi:hypothetical protein